MNYEDLERQFRQSFGVSSRMGKTLDQLRAELRNLSEDERAVMYKRIDDLRREVRRLGQPEDVASLERVLREEGIGSEHEPLKPEGGAVIPNPQAWYSEQHADDPDTVSIYDGDDFPILTVHSREADADVGMGGYTAMELAEFILLCVRDG
jgi:hypothetical protein